MKLDALTLEERQQILDEIWERIQKQEQEEALKQQNEVASKAE